MPGQYHLSVDSLVERAAEAHAAGVPAVIVFGLPARKDEAASEAFDDEGIVQMGVRALRAHVPDLVVMTDVCLCQYTSHGHCGIIQDGEVANDVSLEVLADTAVSHAAGRRRHRRAVRHDGRPGRRDPVGARRRGVRDDVDPRLQRQVRLGLLRAVSRRRALGAQPRRPARLPDGSRKRPGGRARGAARHRRGRRHGDGEAGAAVSRRPAQPARPDPGAARRLPGERGVRDDRRRRRAAASIDERAACSKR